MTAQLSRRSDPVASPLPPVLEFLRTLWSLNHALEVTSSDMRRTTGVTAQQRMVLRIVGHLGFVSAGALSALLHVHPGTLSAALRRLEGRELLARHRDSNDARRVLVMLTPQGEQLLASSEGSVERATTQVLAGADPADVARARTLLEEISRTLDSQHRERADGATGTP